MTENCRKQIDGSCIGCPVLDEIKRRTTGPSALKYQNAIDVVSSKMCPPGMSPETTTHHKPDGTLISVDIVSATGSKVTDTFLLYENVK